MSSLESNDLNKKFDCKCVCDIVRKVNKGCAFKCAAISAHNLFVSLNLTFMRAAVLHLFIYTQSLTKRFQFYIRLQVECARPRDENS